MKIKIHKYIFKIQEIIMLCRKIEEKLLKSSWKNAGNTRKLAVTIMDNFEEWRNIINEILLDIF